MSRWLGLGSRLVALVRDSKRLTLTLACLLVLVNMTLLARLAFARAVPIAQRLSTAPAPRRVPVFAGAGTITGPVRVLGTITESLTVGPLAGAPGSEAWSREFQAQARKLGADAVMDLLAWQEKGDYWQALGLAVEILPPGAAADSCHCVVAMDSLLVDLGAVKETDQARLKASAPMIVARELAKHGYHAVWAESVESASAGGVMRRLPPGQSVERMLDVAFVTTGRSARGVSNPLTSYTPLAYLKGSKLELPEFTTTVTLRFPGGGALWRAQRTGKGIDYNNRPFTTDVVQLGRELGAALDSLPAPARWER